MSTPDDRALGAHPMFFDGRKTAKALRDASERIENLERDNKRMRLEWEDTFDKLQAVVQRIAKRAQRIEEVAREQEAEEVAPDAADSALPALTGRRATIQRQILERRLKMARPS